MKRQWFPKDTKPVRPGIYLIQGAYKKLFWRYWNGTQWYCGTSAYYLSTTIHDSECMGIADIQDVEWCGLIEE